jgi:hypothetical protein
MKRTLAVFSLIILAACGGTEKKEPAAGGTATAPAAATTPALTQAEKEARYVELKKRQEAEAAARVRAAEKKKAAEEAAYTKTPGGKVWAKHREWDRDTCETIAKRQVHVGMTAEQVRLAWGKPEHVNSTVTANRRSEQWVYHSQQYVYFEDDIMTSLQQTK